MVWFPVIERDFNQTRFLTKSPLEILKDNPGNNFKDIRVMIGITSHEMVYAAPCKNFFKSIFLTSFLEL